MQVLQRQWFCNKRCMDIGCNAGAVSLELAERFHTQSMLGVDIDASLIGQARRSASRSAVARPCIQGMGCTALL